MTAATASRQRVFVVSWSDMDRWVVPAPVLMRGTLPKGWTTAKVAELVRLVTDRVEVDAECEYKMAGVRLYGQGVFHRETVRGDQLSAKYVAPLAPGALIYNRLFAWKASFAVVPDEFSDCFVSNEFPQVITDSAKLLPEYLYLWAVSEPTIRAVNAASTGSAAVSRNRFRENFFLEFDISLPPLRTQRAIVSAWDQAQREIAETRQRIAELEEKIETEFLAELGLAKSAAADLPKCFAVRWIDFWRWSVSYNQRSQAGADLTNGTYPVVALGTCLESLQYGTSEKANRDGRGTPILRIKNIKGGEVDTGDLKHIELSDSARAAILLNDGDILIIRTSGSRELVGTCAVFHDDGEYVFASYLIRLRSELGTALADYLAYFINCSLGQAQVDAVSRQIMQSNINTEEIRALEIPLPPLPIQRRIVKKINAGRRMIAALGAEANHKAEQARADVEAMILSGRRDAFGDKGGSQQRHAADGASRRG